MEFAFAMWWLVELASRLFKQFAPLRIRPSWWGPSVFAFAMWSIVGLASRFFKQFAPLRIRPSWWGPWVFAFAVWSVRSLEDPAKLVGSLGVCICYVVSRRTCITYLQAVRSLEDPAKLVGSLGVCM